MKEEGKKYAKEIAAGMVGGGTTIGAISGAGVSGLSGAGITSGLAALGAGSMMAGVFVAPALGYGAYRLTKWVFNTSDEIDDEDLEDEYE